MKDKETTAVVTLRLPRAMHSHLRRLSFSSYVSMNEIMIEALKKFMYTEQGKEIN